MIHCCKWQEVEFQDDIEHFSKKNDLIEIELQDDIEANIQKNWHKEISNKMKLKVKTKLHFMWSSFVYQCNGSIASIFFL